MTLTEVTDATFATEVLESEKPVIVDFWVPWCGPCRALAPVLEEIASTHVDKVRVVKVDIDASPETAAAYHVRSVPTLVAFRDGVSVATVVGAKPKVRLLADLADVLQ